MLQHVGSATRTALLLACAITTGCSQSTSTFQDAVTRHANGAVAAEGQTRYGKKVGPWTHYREDGSKESVVSYEEGVRTFLLRYHQNGEQALVGEFSKGERDGIWHYLSPYGDAVKQETYKEGVLIKRVDEKEERVTYYYESGQVRLIGTFRDGEEDGDYVSYYENGHQKERGAYRDGARHGVWVYWTEQGDVLRREVWTNGEQVR